LKNNFSCIKADLDDKNNLQSWGGGKGSAGSAVEE
jgi:hypothetical protein